VSGAHVADVEWLASELAVQPVHRDQARLRDFEVRRR
jgi:hypothetical protein